MISDRPRKQAPHLLRLDPRNAHEQTRQRQLRGRHIGGNDRRNAERAKFGRRAGILPRAARGADAVVHAEIHGPVPAGRVRRARAFQMFQYRRRLHAPRAGHPEEHAGQWQCLPVVLGIPIEAAAHRTRMVGAVRTGKEDRSVTPFPNLVGGRQDAPHKRRALERNRRIARDPRGEIRRIHPGEDVRVQASRGHDGSRRFVNMLHELGEGDRRRGLEGGLGHIEVNQVLSRDVPLVRVVVGDLHRARRSGVHEQKHFMRAECMRRTGQKKKRRDDKTPCPAAPAVGF
ncbi:MAG: hypothetical protein BWY59_01655 [Verrucomicrobia bacterium ADurb.Bin345]|nr:MAG: hypothetical protein BWY59_01655 [Verrucomicrobia bacterium ADurb.Bin345]